MKKHAALLAAGALVASLGLSACSSSMSSTSTTPVTSTTQPVATTATKLPASLASPAGTAGKEPTVVVPTTAPNGKFMVGALIPGSGPAVKAGDKVTVQYVLATYSSGKTVQSSWSSQPFSFVVGQGQVIPGWDEGLIGAQAGGRYELIIPPSLGYGAQSPGAGIAPNDTLIFIVDVLSIG